MARLECAVFILGFGCGRSAATTTAPDASIADSTVVADASDVIVHGCNNWADRGQLVDESRGNGWAISADHDGAVEIAGMFIVNPGQFQAAYGGVMRLTPDGSRDASFGTDGVVLDTNAFAWKSIAARPNGGWYVSGDAKVSSQDIGEGIRADAAIDPTFCSYANNGGGSVAREVSGKLVTVSKVLSSSTTNDFVVHRRDASCTLDVTYGSAGSATIPNVPFNGTAKILPDGGVVVVYGAITVKRLDPTGAPLAGWGDGNGTKVVSIDGTNPSAGVIELAFGVGDDGSILLAADASEVTSIDPLIRDYWFFASRLAPTGLVDSSFDRTAVRDAMLGFIPTAIAALADGIVLIGEHHGAPEAWRLNAAGTPAWTSGGRDIDYGSFNAVAVRDDLTIIAAGNWRGSNLLAVCYDSSL